MLLLGLIKKNIQCSTPYLQFFSCGLRCLQYLYQKIFFIIIVLQVALSDHYISSAIVALIPLVYIIGVAVYHCIRRFQGQKGDEVTSSLPDRLLHSDQFRDSLSFIAAS